MRKWTDKVQRDDFDRMVKRGLTAVGAHLTGEAMTRCPYITHRLQNSITWAIQSAQSDIKSPALGGDKIGRPSDKYTCYVGTNVEYAQVVEYGQSGRGERTSIKTRRTAKATGGRAAKPYLRSAMDENRKECREIFRDYIKDMVRGK